MKFCEFRFLALEGIQPSGVCGDIAPYRCAECGIAVCSRHSVFIEELGRHLCSDHFLEYKKTGMPHPVGPEPLSPPRNRPEIGPTRRKKVKLREEFSLSSIYIRKVVQDRVLTARAVYIFKGGGMLETPYGDVYLTKEQFEFMFEEIEE